MKPIIGIVGRAIDNGIFVKDEIRNAVIKSGGIPLLILPTQTLEFNNILEDEDNGMSIIEKKDLLDELKLCNGIIMPGGSKIFNYDKYICKYAIENNIPILGICLGMQIMACNDAYNSLKKIEKEINHNQIGIKYVHKVTTRPNSILNDIFGDTIIVNSRHKEYVTNIGNYIITGISEDNIIEGIEYPFNVFNVGVQWHPESMINYDIKQFDLFKKFIEHSKKI